MSTPKVLIIDDDRSFASQIERALEGSFQVDCCYSEEDFRERFTVGRYDLLIMDMRLREAREGLDLLREALERDPAQATMVMTAYADTASYGEAIASGAMTYLDKREFSPALIARTVEAIVQQGLLRRKLAAVEQRLEVAESQEMIGVSSAIKEVGEAVRRAAEDGFSPVLIIGEPGSGRELVARLVHRLNRRRCQGPFVLASCVFSDPSGHEMALFGDFQATDGLPVRDSMGWIDQARGGVLYVEGVESLSSPASDKLAGAIREGRFSRAEGSPSIQVDAQIVLSIRSLNDGAFPTQAMRDAFEREGGIRITVPPLRERKEDLALLAQYTLQQLFRSGRTGARSFRGAALALLEEHDWPGNVRELRSAIEYAATRADVSGDREIGPEHLPFAGTFSGGSLVAGATMDYKRHLARAECDLVEQAGEQNGLSTQTAIADRLGYNDRFTFSRRIRKHFEIYPDLVMEFPRTAALFEDLGVRRVS